ncbi:MAG: hypothetical protein JWL98_942 [Xanthomonadaceae bacterium]|nr:hypothetical protein [Xanthomonadaceae bacterium]
MTLSGLPFTRHALLRVALLSCLFPVSHVAMAGAADAVYTPTVEQGETEFELRGGYRNFGGAPDEHAFVFDVGYGVNSRWRTEAVLEYAAEGGEQGKLEALEWENVFVLTEPGKYWMDLGLLAEYEHSFGSGPDEIKIGPLLQKEIGPAVANLNFRFTREVGSGSSNDTGLDYRWQVRWRGNEALEWGAQGLGELGTVDHLSQGDWHSAGPAIFGTRRLAGRDKIRYNAAVLAGLGGAAPDAAVRFQVEYEMY